MGNLLVPNFHAENGQKLLLKMALLLFIWMDLQIFFYILMLMLFATELTKTKLI